MAFALLVFAVSAAEGAVNISVAGVQVRLVAVGEESGGPFDPDGENQLTRDDGFDVCCQSFGTCLPVDGPYAAGDEVTLNTYWMDIMPDPIPRENWVVDWSLSIELESGDFVDLWESQRIDFGPLDDLFQPGDEVRFCVAGIVELEQAWCPGLISQLHGTVTPTGELPFAESDPGSDDDSLLCERDCLSRVAVLPKAGAAPIVGAFLRHGLSTSVTTTIDYAIYDFAGHLVGSWIDGPETFELGDDYRFVGPLPGVGELAPGRYRLEVTIDGMNGFHTVTENFQILGED